MSPKLRRWSWFPIALLIVAAGALSHQLLPGVEDTDLAQSRFLGEQRCAQVRAQVAVQPEFLRLEGSLRAMVAGSAVTHELRFLLHHSLIVDRVEVDGRLFEERTARGAALFSESRNRRRFVPAPGGEGATSAGEAHEVIVRFHGSVRAVTRSPWVFPLVLRPDDLLLPQFAMSCEGLELELVCPRDWEVMTSASELASPASEDRASVRIRDDGPRAPVLALGPMQRQTWADDRRTVELGSPSKAMPVDAEELWPTVGEVEHMVDGSLDRSLRVVFVPDGAELVEELAPGFWTVRESVAMPGIAMVVARTLVAEIELPAELSVIPELAALWTRASMEGVEARRTVRGAASGDRRRWLDAWIAAAAAHSRQAATAAVRAAFRAREDGGPVPDIADGELAATLRWAANEDVQLSFTSIALGAVGTTWDLDAVARVRPAPPAGVKLPPVRCLAIGRNAQGDSVHAMRLEVEWDGGRGVIHKQRMRSPSERLVLDPEEVFPDADRADHIAWVRSGLEPALFAISENDDVLAVAPFRRAHLGGDPYGLYVFPFGTDGAKDSRWFEVDGEITGLEWVPGSEALLVETQFEGRRRQALLDLSEGRWRPFQDHAKVDPAGHRVLLERRQAPGRWRHSLYEFQTRRERPFLNSLPGSLRWLDQGALLLGALDGGHSSVRDVDGSEIAQLEFDARQLRGVKADDVGFTFVVDGADGSSLLEQSFGAQPAGANVVYRAGGRILEYHRALDSPDVWIFEERDGKFAIVHRGAIQPLLYVDSLRPVQQLPSGALLVGDAEAAGELVELSFLSYRRDHSGGGEPQTICPEAFPQPSPRPSRSGRYLYYLRTRPGEAAVLDALHCSRVLVRYDFLREREETVFDGHPGS